MATTHPLPIGQQARWLNVIEEFEFEVQHRPGKAHTNADAMSRWPYNVDAIHDNTVERRATAELPGDWSLETLVSEQRREPDLNWIAQRRRESEHSPSYDEVRPMSRTVKVLVAQWPQIKLDNERVAGPNLAID